MAVWIHQRGSCYHLKTLLTDDIPDGSCIAAMRGNDQTENACCVKAQLMKPQNALLQDMAICASLQSFQWSCRNPCRAMSAAPCCCQEANESATTGGILSAITVKQGLMPVLSAILFTASTPSLLSSSIHSAWVSSSCEPPCQASAIPT